MNEEELDIKAKQSLRDLDLAVKEARSNYEPYLFINKPTHDILKKSLLARYPHLKED